MIAVIIQARTRSKRYSGKIYEDINGKSTLQRVLEGVKSAQSPHKIILAMPEYDEAVFVRKQAWGEFKGCIDSRFCTYFGNPDDLVDRYFQAARKEGADLIVRVTADCPMIQGNIIDEMLGEYLKNGYNGLMGNNELVSSTPYPDGTDVEIFPYWMLSETRQLTKDPYNLEHVTPWMYRRGTEYDIHQFHNCRPNTMITRKFADFSFDTDEDYRLLQAITKNYDAGMTLDEALKATNFQIKEWQG